MSYRLGANLMESSEEDDCILSRGGDEEAEEIYYKSLLNVLLDLDNEYTEVDVKVNNRAINPIVLMDEFKEELKLQEYANEVKNAAAAEIVKVKNQLRKQYDLRIKKKLMVRQLIPSLHSTYAAIPHLSIKKVVSPKLSKAKTLASFTSRVNEVVNKIVKISRKKAAKLASMLIQDKEEYKVALEAKAAGFKGNLILGSNLGVLEADEIARKALAAGFTQVIKVSSRGSCVQVISLEASPNGLNGSSCS